MRSSRAQGNISSRREEPSSDSNREGGGALLKTGEGSVETIRKGGRRERSLSWPLEDRLTGPEGRVGAAAAGGAVGVEALVDGGLAAGGDLVRIHLRRCVVRRPAGREGGWSRVSAFGADARWGEGGGTVPRWRRWANEWLVGLGGGPHLSVHNEALFWKFCNKWKNSCIFQKKKSCRIQHNEAVIPRLSRYLRTYFKF
jgi:hypothetical protein